MKNEKKVSEIFEEILALKKSVLTREVRIEEMEYIDSNQYARVIKDFKDLNLSANEEIGVLYTKLNEIERGLDK